MIRRNNVFNTKDSYGLISRIFHWLIAVLVLFMIFLGYFMGDVAQAMRANVVNIHKVTGLTILCLMVCRAIWALINPKPDLPAGSAVWEYYLSRLVHFLLYLFLIIMPITGWIMASAAGKPPHIFGFLIALPVNKSKSLADLFVSIHNTLAIIIIFFISLHVLAALYHYYVKKDNVLQRMLY